MKIFIVILGIFYTYLAFGAPASEIPVDGASRLLLSGPIRLHLIITPHQSRLSLYTNPIILKQICLKLTSGALYLNNPTKQLITAELSLPKVNAIQAQGAINLKAEGLRGPLDLNLDGDSKVFIKGAAIDLHQLTLSNAAKLKITGVQSSGLDINDSSSGKLILDGSAINLQNLLYRGTGSITAYWIQSNNLNIAAQGKGMLSLAGAVNRLEVNLKDCMFLDAKHLKANTAFIRTYDQTQAQVWTWQNLTAEPWEQSVVSYYHDSLVVLNRVTQPGSLIRMVGAIG